MTTLSLFYKAISTNFFGIEPEGFLETVAEDRQKKRSVTFRSKAEARSSLKWTVMTFSAVEQRGAISWTVFKGQRPRLLFEKLN